ncbi:Complex 1 LYR protein and Methyltransferase type 11 domain containing protein [Aphelenchoides fujianensis]|nr:Complex 1 LYR protein and Methyltransferase type 11 domain containing protein [Aphelenchoides fujianensis]
MPLNSGVTTSIQQQLSADWDNREFNYLIAEQVKQIADNVGQFYLTSLNKLASLNDKVTRLERKIEFLEANTAVKSVTPVTSRSAEEARLGRAASLQGAKITPKFWFDYELQDLPLPVFRNVLKREFTKNAHITDVRIIDRKVGECYKDIESIQWAFYNPDHVRNFLFRENVEPKAKDFLSKFLSGN